MLNGIAKNSTRTTSATGATIANRPMGASR